MVGDLQGQLERSRAQIWLAMLESEETTQKLADCGIVVEALKHEVCPHLICCSQVVLDSFTEDVKVSSGRGIPGDLCCIKS